MTMRQPGRLRATQHRSPRRRNHYASTNFCKSADR
jgi:hypothetical protein